MVRTLLLSGTLVAFVVDFGIAAHLRATRPQSFDRYEQWSSIINVGVFGAWALFGHLHGVALFLVGVYACIQAKGASVVATKRGEQHKDERDG